MAFFQDLGGRLSEAAQFVGKRTSTASMIGRLSRESVEIREEIDRLYLQIGKVCYAAHNNQGEMQFSEQLCAKIDALRGELQSIDEKIDELRGQRRCLKCGEVSGDGALFCAKCGEKLPIPQVTIEPEPEGDDEPQQEPAAESAEEPARVRRDAGDANVQINWPEPGGEAETPAEEESIDEA